MAERCINPLRAIKHLPCSTSESSTGIRCATVWVHGREYALGTRSTNLQSLVNMVRVQKGTLKYVFRKGTYLESTSGILEVLKLLY